MTITSTMVNNISVWNGHFGYGEHIHLYDFVQWYHAVQNVMLILV